MSWNLSEVLDYYKHQGAPANQSVVISLLTEIQQAHGGSIPKHLLSEIAVYYSVKETLLLAIIRRIPRLRLADTHLLEICAGPNCGKSAALARNAEILCASHPGKIILKFVPCMRLCGKGPNLKWDGTLYHRADEVLLKQLIEQL